MNGTDLARLFASETPRLLRRLRCFRGKVTPEDVVQSAFAKMLEQDMSRIEDPKAYLSRLVHNLALDELRRQQRAPLAPSRTVELEHRLSPPARSDLRLDCTPEQMLIEGERFAHMTATVLALPEKERLALLWFKLKGLSHAEIGQRLGVSRHNVPNYLSRALAKCADAMAAFERAGLDGPDDRVTGN